jgi:hypothetical protein
MQWSTPTGNLPLLAGNMLLKSTKLIALNSCVGLCFFYRVTESFLLFDGLQHDIKGGLR